MNIIFAKHKEILDHNEVDLDQLREQYSLVPLDKIRIGKNKEVLQSWCLIPADNAKVLDDAPHLPRLIELHETMMQNYYEQQWDYCIESAEKLLGKFGGEVDSFYEIFIERCQQNKTHGVKDNWDGVITRVSNVTD